jgi:4-amino-4-deoxy-L-arabinose transferase-like glycosyltransferase
MRAAIPATANQRHSSTERTLIVLFSAAALLVHLLTNGRYGYFRDELYYIACGRHLDFGYVDQPPLSILLLRLSEICLGDSLFAIRLLPALARAATVALTGLIARELGGREWAITLACAGSLCALFNLAVGNLFSMNAFEPLFWMGAVYLLVRVINGSAPTLWIWFGVLLGLGIENKHSTVFFGVGIFVALLLTHERRHFTNKWIWLGGLIAFAIALPNLLWQVRHHWPTYELLSNIAHSNKKRRTRSGTIHRAADYFDESRNTSAVAGRCVLVVCIARRPALSHYGLSSVPYQCRTSSPKNIHATAPNAR